MKIVPKLVVMSLPLLMASCAWQVQMMPRDSGKVYSGEVRGNGFGSGTITVNIDGEIYTGPIVRTGSNGSFGFFQAYGGGKNTFATAQTLSSNVTVKAILSSHDNHGLRCDIVGDGHGHGSGICLDDQGKVYDAIFGN